MEKKKNEKVDLSLDNEEFYKRYGRKKIVSTFTLGCKVNQYETEALVSMFENNGYKIVDFEDSADVYVINTCTVTGLSARKSRQMIRRAKSHNNDSVVVVTGCYSQTEPREVLSIPGVNLVVGTKDRGRIIEYIRQIEGGQDKINGVSDIMRARAFEELKVTEYKGRTRAFLKIQEGCSQFCSYCIIPYARGPIRSREPVDVIEEVKRLAQKGFKEIVLTGIHIASYGKDLNRSSLLDIIKNIHDIDGIERIRIGSIEPTTITSGFVSDIRSLDKLCPHYHISLQSGCDETLKRMNRRYNTSGFREAVELLRNNISDVALTTDVMVGFPGETEEEFEKTYEFLKEIAFAKMHVFKYSPREGTPAAGYPDQVDPRIKEERSSILITMSERNTLAFNSRYIGKNVSVLFEQEANEEKDYYEGLTPNYIRVLCRGNDKICGNISEVRLEEAIGDHTKGRIMEEGS